MTPGSESVLPKLIFATNNAHKVAEIHSVLDRIMEVVSLQQAGIFIDIPEPHQTLEANASEKSRTIYTLTGLPCFSEDTGLETEALNGEPGVLSARYAGEGKNSTDNIEKLLAKLQHHTNRRARFRTVISLLLNDKEMLFEGICEGDILHDPRGAKGFGYDPVFRPAGSTHSFAEMNMEEKNQFSHRKKAVIKLVDFLKQYIPAK